MRFTPAQHCRDPDAVVIGYLVSYEDFTVKEKRLENVALEQTAEVFVTPQDTRHPIVPEKTVCQVGITEEVPLHIGKKL